MAFYKSALFKQLIGGNPIVIVDVGARGGLNKRWQPLKDSLKVIGFEPDDAEFRRLSETAKSNQVYLPTALAGETGKVKLNITRNPVCSSTLEPNYSFVNRFLFPEDFELADTVEVKGSTLSDMLKTMDLDVIDFIKLDTQGSELQILKGAESALAEYGFFGIEVEVELSPLYKDQSLFADIDTFLRDKGYAFFDITIPLGRKIRKTVPADKSKNLRGQGLWTDAIYFRDFISSKYGYLERFARETAIKSLAIAEIHGFADFSLELLDLYSAGGILSAVESAAVKNALFSSVEGKFHPELRLYNNLKRAAREFLSDRFPSAHKLIINTSTRNRG